MAKKHKRGNHVTQSVEYCQSLIGKTVAVRDDKYVLCGEVSGVQVYISRNGLQGVKIHLEGEHGYYHLDDLIFVYP